MRYLVKYLTRQTMREDAAEHFRPCQSENEVLHFLDENKHRIHSWEAYECRRILKNGEGQ